MVLCAITLGVMGARCEATTGGAHGDIVQEIITIVRQVSNGPPPGQPDPLDDDVPGG